MCIQECHWAKSGEREIKMLQSFYTVLKSSFSSFSICLVDENLWLFFWGLRNLILKVLRFLVSWRNRLLELYFSLFWGWKMWCHWGSVFFFVCAFWYLLLLGSFCTACHFSLYFLLCNFCLNFTVLSSFYLYFGTFGLSLSSFTLQWRFHFLVLAYLFAFVAFLWYPGLIIFPYPPVFPLGTCSQPLFLLQTPDNH